MVGQAHIQFLLIISNFILYIDVRAPPFFFFIKFCCYRILPQPDIYIYEPAYTHTPPYQCSVGIRTRNLVEIAVARCYNNNIYILLCTCLCQIVQNFSYSLCPLISSDEELKYKTLWLTFSIEVLNTILCYSRVGHFSAFCLYTMFVCVVDLMT